MKELLTLIAIYLHSDDIAASSVVEVASKEGVELALVDEDCMWLDVYKGEDDMIARFVVPDSKYNELVQAGVTEV